MKFHSVGPWLVTLATLAGCASTLPVVRVGTDVTNPVEAKRLQDLFDEA